MKNSFPDRLKKARIAKKLSQSKLGELANLKSTIICTYEKGRRSPTLTTLLNLATILGVTPGWLVGEPEKNVKTIKINPNEMIIELRERIKDKDDFATILKESIENKKSVIANLTNENVQLRKEMGLGKGALMRKNG